MAQTNSPPTSPKSPPQDAYETTPLLAESASLDDEEAAPLRRVAGPIPNPIFFILGMECCERATYFGLVGPLQNYIQNKRGDAFHRGLGLGQANATRFNLAFNVLCYISPIAGAVLADQYFGRYRIIKYSSVVYILGLCVLFVTSLPSSQELNVGLPGLIVALIFIGLGTGGMKSTLAAWIADQYSKEGTTRSTGDEVVRLKGVGTERVVIDREMSVARAFLFFYAAAQVGSFSNLLTTTLELRKGFPFAFFLPLPMFVVGFITIVVKNGTLTKLPPQGSPLYQSIKRLLRNILHKPSTSNDNDINAQKEMYRALSTCKIFLLFPFYFVCHLQMFTNFISQGGTLETHGVPNDLLISINPLTVIIFVPTLDTIIYPLLQKYNVRPGPIARISLGFLFMSLSMAYAAALQSAIYNAPPCYSHPRHEDCHDGTTPNRIHIAAQIPAYVLGGISEVFTLSTGMEWAAMRAPISMRSLVVAVFVATFAGGAGLAMLVSPLARDPLLVNMYAVLSTTAGSAGVVFWFLFRGEEEELGEAEGQGMRVEEREVRGEQVSD